MLKALVNSIRDVYDEGDEINIITITERLNAKGKLAECGGAGAIAQFASGTTCDEIAESALDCMLDNWRARRAAQIGKELGERSITVDEAVTKLAEIQKPTESDLPPIVDAAELIGKPIILPDDVIEGVLHRGSKMVAAGGSKIYKTWLLGDTAVSVATGTDWLGKFSTRREMPNSRAWKCSERLRHSPPLVSTSHKRDRVHPKQRLGRGSTR